MLHHISGGAWDPHDVNVVASTSESSIQFWDLRTMKYALTLVKVSSPSLVMQKKDLVSSTISHLNEKIEFIVQLSL